MQSPLYITAHERKMKEYFTNTIPDQDAALPQYKPLRKTTIQPMQRASRSVTPVRINDTYKSTITIGDKPEKP